MRIRHTSSVREIDFKQVLKSKSITVVLNRDLISSEINRLQSEVGKYNNKTDDKNIKILVSYLTKLKRASDRETSELELRWSIANDGTLVSNPTQFINEPVYRIDTNNFIDIGANQQLVSIDISRMSDVIAFDMINRDLDETHASIEKLLSNCSIVSPNDISILTDKFNENGDKMYELSQFMKIGNSTFLNSDDRIMYNYFMSKKYEFTKKESTYKEPVKNSCMLAAGLYASQLIYNINKCKVLCGAVEITPKRITLLLNIENDKLFDFKDRAFEDITIDAFGRQFQFKPDVHIY